MSQLFIWNWKDDDQIEYIQTILQILFHAFIIFSISTSCSTLAR